MSIKFDAIVFRELTAAVAVTALYGIAGWDMREPLAVFVMFAIGLCMQEWLIDKWEVRRNAKAHKPTDRKYHARHTA